MIVNTSVNFDINEQPYRLLNSAVDRKFIRTCRDAQKYYVIIK